MLVITDYYHHFYYGIIRNVTYGLLLTLLTKLFFGFSVILQNIPPHFLTFLPEPHTTHNLLQTRHIKTLCVLLSCYLV